MVSTQVVPQSLEVLRQSLIADNGVPTLDPQEASIPAIWLAGKDCGLPNNSKGKLVPVVSDVLAKSSGLGIVPLLFSEGGLAPQPPALAAVKFELWTFLRRAVKPKKIDDATAWIAEFKKDTWEPATVPTLQWPRPDPVQGLVEAG